MKIAILYVSTGRYHIFWKDFYSSSERFFLPSTEKHYFIFTDNNSIYTNNSKIHYIEQSNLGWPQNTLFRYHMFKKIVNTLLHYDYCFFFNGNAEFCDEINTEFLPPVNTMLFVQHPGFFDKLRMSFPYETNPLSSAFIPPSKGNVYVCGGINGASSPVYVKFIDSIVSLTDQDIKNGITAIWHDESYSNKYAIFNKYMLKDPGFCYPENKILPFSPKIKIRDKDRFGGHNYLRCIADKPTHVDQTGITVNICGGLGNQMFQYACGRALSLKYGVPLHLDLSWYTSSNMITPRQFALEIFPALKRASKVWTEAKYLNSRAVMAMRLRKHISPNTSESPCIPSIIYEPEFDYWPGIKCVAPPVHLFGYWQNEQYFEQIKETIRRDFTFPTLPYESQQISDQISLCENSVAVHIRRGDYVDNTDIASKHGLCSLEYYYKSIQYIKKKASIIKIFLFSDDPEWANANFKTDGISKLVVNVNSEDLSYNDMHLMSLCRHHIIANSSFSWWGAWLSNNNGIIICPSKWFIEEHSTKYNPCPKRWLLF